MPNAERSVSAGTQQHQTILFGMWIIGAALVVTFFIVPQLKRWRARELQIRTAQSQLRDMASVVQGQPQLETVIAQQEQVLAMQPRRVLRARSRALAASALQSLVQDVADASNVTVTRLDVANAEATGDLPITLAANGDIYGLANLLQQLRSARYAVVVDKLTTQNNSALRGAADVLQITLSLHAPVIVQ